MTNKRIIRFWLIITVVLLALFIALQVPASWLLRKFAPNMRQFHNVSGNIWQGQADWSYQQLNGTVQWTTRPWEVLRLRMASHLVIRSGQTQLEGVVSYGIGKKIYLQHINGKISPETLMTLVHWQWPANSIQINDLTMQYQRGTGFQDAQGDLSWAGGSLSYPMQQRWERIEIPPITGQVAAEQQKLKLAVKDSQKQRMMDFAVGSDGMLDVQVTQRFLLNAPSYQGKAGLDSTVLTTRQPLNQLNGM